MTNVKLNRKMNATEYCGGYLGSYDSTEEELNDLREKAKEQGWVEAEGD